MRKNSSSDGEKLSRLKDENINMLSSLEQFVQTVKNSELFLIQNAISGGFSEFNTLEQPEQLKFKLEEIIWI